MMAVDVGFKRGPCNARARAALVIGLTLAPGLAGSEGTGAAPTASAGGGAVVTGVPGQGTVTIIEAWTSGNIGAAANVYAFPSSHCGEYDSPEDRNALVWTGSESCSASIPAGSNGSSSVTYQYAIFLANGSVAQIQRKASQVQANAEAVGSDGDGSAVAHAIHAIYFQVHDAPVKVAIAGSLTGSGSGQANPRSEAGIRDSNNTLWQASLSAVSEQIELQPGYYGYYIHCEADAGAHYQGPPSSSSTAALDLTLDFTGQPLVSVLDAVGNEGTGSPGSLTFFVSLSNASSQTVTVDYATVPETAGAGDYDEQFGTLTFVPGDQLEEVTVELTPDADGEPEETFRLELTNPTNAVIADGIGIGTILDDDCDNAYTDGDDVITGTPGDDVLCGGAGNDTIDGGGGNDTLIGGAGNDALVGGIGDDTIHGGDGDDFINGGEGNDIIDAGPGSDNEVRGGPGNDTLQGGEGNDILHGDEGDDTLRGDAGADFLYGDEPDGPAGNDWLEGGGDPDDLYGYAGNDTLHGEEGEDHIQGGSGGDVIFGGPGDNPLLDGESGDDFIYGQDGADKLYGGPGADELYGGEGNDELIGGEENAAPEDEPDGSDDLFGGGGDDELYGGPGNDVLYGEDGLDEVYGESGDDTLEGGTGADFPLNGGDGADKIYGGAGEDWLFGGDDASADELYGGDDHDELFGGPGDDTRLFGGAGADGIDGGPGNDILHGGIGDDALTGGSGYDRLFGEGGNDTSHTCDGEADVILGGPGADTANLDNQDVTLAVEQEALCP